MKPSNLSELVKPKTDNRTYSALDYEETFLGAIIGGVVEWENIHRVKKDFFINKETSNTFGALQTCEQQTGSIDYISVLDILSKSVGSFQAKGYIDKLVSKVPPDVNMEKLISSIQNNYIVKEATQFCDRAKLKIQEQPYLASEIIVSLQEHIDKITDFSIDDNFVSDIDKAVFNIIDPSGEKFIIKTGLRAVDDVIGGISTSEVTFIGARPGHGKTSTAVSLALSILENNPDTVVNLFTLEMSNQQIMNKFIANVSKVSSYKMRLGKTTPEENELIRQAGEKLKSYKGRLCVFENIYDISAMRRIARQTNAKLVMVDYIGLMDGVSEDTRNSMAKMARIAKRFCKSKNSAWLFFSQLNRNPEMRESKRPESGDLAESDQLAHIASEILLLFYKFKYSKDITHVNDLFFIWDKTRYSGVADKKVFFNGDICVIKDIPGK